MRCILSQESQAQAAREEHADSLKKLRAFCDKLQSECSQLRDKRQALSLSLESHQPIHRADASGEVSGIVHPSTKGTGTCSYSYSR